MGRRGEGHLCQSLSLWILHERDLDWLLVFAAAAVASRGMAGHGGGGIEGCSEVHEGGKGG